LEITCRGFHSIAALTSSEAGHAGQVSTSSPGQFPPLPRTSAARELRGSSQMRGNFTRPRALPASVGRVSCWSGLADAVGIPPVEIRPIRARTHPTAAGHSLMTRTAVHRAHGQKSAGTDKCCVVFACVRTYERTGYRPGRSWHALSPARTLKYGCRLPPRSDRAPIKE
jgi:hypothetical protein